VGLLALLPLGWHNASGGGSAIRELLVMKRLLEAAGETFARDGIVYGPLPNRREPPRGRNY
jgi:hypothetical protein